MSTARLTFAPTALSSDAFYIAGMRVADAFVGLELNGKFIAVVSPLELGNFRQYSHCHKVLSLSDVKKSLPAGAPMAAVIAQAARRVGARKLLVGDDFPAGLFLQLKKFIPTSIEKGPLFPERLIKTAQEQNEIRKANKICAEGIALCADHLHRAKVVKNKLTLKGEIVTSELLRKRVQTLFLNRGLEPFSELIIAGGRQACDPHCLGSGPLRPGELIIVDLFAPLQKSRYWGDMTRTFLKGTPTDAQAKLVHTVLAAQKEAVQSIRPGIDGAKIHARIVERFAAAGYRTRATAKGYEGFFHGTGHSLGLDCHDLAGHGKSIGGKKTIFKAGEVYTVEPGLYYPSIGGCRIEDNGVVTKTGFQLLSAAPTTWQL